jgi:hypothetical protein
LGILQDLKISGLIKVLKSSWDISCVIIELKPSFSDIRNYVDVDPDDGDGRCLRNVGFYLNVDTADRPRRF